MGWTSFIGPAVSVAKEGAAWLLSDHDRRIALLERRSAWHHKRANMLDIRAAIALGTASGAPKAKAKRLTRRAKRLALRAAKHRARSTSLLNAAMSARRLYKD